MPSIKSATKAQLIEQNERLNKQLIAQGRVLEDLRLRLSVAEARRACSVDDINLLAREASLADRRDRWARH